MLKYNLKKEFITFLKKYNLYNMYRFNLIHNSIWDYISLSYFFDYVDCLHYMEHSLFVANNSFTTKSGLWLMYAYTYLNVQGNLEKEILLKLDEYFRSHLVVDCDNNDFTEIISNFIKKVIKKQKDLKVNYPNIYRYILYHESKNNSRL